MRLNVTAVPGIILLYSMFVTTAERMPPTEQSCQQVELCTSPRTQSTLVPVQVELTGFEPRSTLKPWGPMRFIKYLQLAICSGLRPLEREYGHIIYKYCTYAFCILWGATLRKGGNREKLETSTSV